MRGLCALAVGFLLLTVINSAFAGFRYDPVYGPQICTYFQRDAGRSVDDRYNPSDEFKQARIYIEGLPLGLQGSLAA
jgi:hypothetical protein